MCDPKIAVKNKSIWLAQQAAMQYTPSEVADQMGASTGFTPCPSARSTGTRTAKKLRKSQKLRAVIGDTLREDMLELKRDAAAAVEDRRRSNQRLQGLVSLVKEIAHERDNSGR